MAHRILSTAFCSDSFPSVFNVDDVVDIDGWPEPPDGIWPTRETAGHALGLSSEETGEAAGYLDDTDAPGRCAHIWPAELDADGGCERCGLAYSEYAVWD